MKKWDKWITLAPIALVLAFLPLVVGRINSKTYTENEPWLPANAVESDFFLYGKLFVLFFCCLFMIVILARMRFWWQIHEIPKYFLFLLGYGFLAIVSSLRAEHPFLSIRGMTGNMQGLFVILSYLVVFFYSFLGVKKTENISILIKILGVSIGILGVIGISQFFGFVNGLCERVSRCEKGDIFAFYIFDFVALELCGELCSASSAGDGGNDCLFP